MSYTMNTDEYSVTKINSCYNSIDYDIIKKKENEIFLMFFYLWFVTTLGYVIISYFYRRLESENVLLLKNVKNILFFLNDKFELCSNSEIENLNPYNIDQLRYEIMEIFNEESSSESCSEISDSNSSSYSGSDSGSDSNRNSASYSDIEN